MDLSKITVMDTIEQKMRYHSARQSVLAENIANANTPGYAPKDIGGGSFEQMVNKTNSVSMAVTNPMHISSAGNMTSGFSTNVAGEMFEVTPRGNAVVLEEEMIKMQANSMDYQATTSLYRKMARLMTSALGE